MQQYLDKEHMQEKANTIVSDSQYFRPHFGIFKEDDASQSKICIVFDASTKSQQRVVYWS